MLIRKRYLENVRPFVGLDVVKVITGMRRSGKSVLMEQIRDEIVLKDGFSRTVISMDPVDMSSNGVRHMNICDFLQQPQ